MIDTLPVSHNHLLIIGDNRIADVLYQYSGKLFWPDHDLVGLVTINSAERELQRGDSLQILGDLSDLKEIVGQHAIQKVIIAIDLYDVQKLHEVILTCVREGIEYEIAPQFYDIIFGGASKEVVGKFFRSFEWNLVRLMDIFISAFFLFLSMPLWIFISIFIKLTSSGSVLYSQERVGKDGQLFRAYKFRTMYSTFERFTSLPDNSRSLGILTPVGRFLRKTRLEDIPLLLNVLAGDMSIIGPECERPYYHEKYISEVPFYENRLKIKPGLIGYSQVELDEREIIEDIREKLRYDFYYVDHCDSFSLNTKIVLKAIFLMSKSNNFVGL